MGRQCSSFLAVAACVLLHAARASACGVSGPDGVWSCSLAEHEEELRPRWNVGVAGSYTSTELRFSQGLRADQTRHALVATAAYAPAARWSFQLSAGVAFAGQLETPDGAHTFAPGPAAAISGTYRVLSGSPFLALSAVLSASTAQTRLREQQAHYSALDLRFGAVFGATFFDALSPYAVARVFGGPVFWRYQGRAVVGTDLWHFQLGAGLSWLIAERVALFVEGIPLGERGLTGGVAAVF